MPKNGLTEECYRRSVDLIKTNSDKHGTSAALRWEENGKYANIFARDAGISILGMAASGDPKLAELARANLKTLAGSQTKFGQIPSSVDPAKGERLFYYLGSVDSTLWWLIALDSYVKRTGDKQFMVSLEKEIKRAFRWLFCQDTNQDGLLEQGEASDWADYMPGNGIVLYTNVLWYRALEVYGYKEEAALAADGINNLFLPHRANPNRSLYLKGKYHRLKTLAQTKALAEDKPYYLHYVSFRCASDRCDVFGNLLAILFGLATPARAKAIIAHMRNNAVSDVYPVQAFFPPIEKGDPDWREYLEKSPSLNGAYGYHNGGIWPMIGGFWAAALHKTGKTDLAAKELVRLAEMNSLNDWQFNEWFHGQTGEPKGMPGQTWNAGAYLFAWHYLRGEIK
jgi:glycogen debranching enzyme